MPLRALIQSFPETLSDMLLAAQDRFVDAEELLLQQRFDGSIYLFGYAAEMWLKAACLRLRGLGPTVQVLPALTALRSWMKLKAPRVIFTDYHDLAYFADCVVSLRHDQKRPLPPVLATELQARISNGLHLEWIVDMRYRRSGLTDVDAWAGLVNAWWLKMNWTNLL